MMEPQDPPPPSQGWGGWDPHFYVTTNAPVTHRCAPVFLRTFQHNHEHSVRQSFLITHPAPLPPPAAPHRASINGKRRGRKVRHLGTVLHLVSVWFLVLEGEEEEEDEELRSKRLQTKVGQARKWGGGSKTNHNTRQVCADTPH